jgi:hypothetical protein
LTRNIKRNCIIISTPILDLKNTNSLLVASSKLPNSNLNNKIAINNIVIIDTVGGKKLKYLIDDN